MNAEFTKNLRELTPHQKAFFKAFPNLFERINMRMYEGNKVVAGRHGLENFEEDFQKAIDHAEEIFLNLTENFSDAAMSIVEEKLSILFYFFFCYHAVNECKEHFDETERSSEKPFTFLTRLGMFEHITSRSDKGSFFDTLAERGENNYENFRQVLNEITLEEIAAEDRKAGGAK